MKHIKEGDELKFKIDETTSMFIQVKARSVVVRTVPSRSAALVPLAGNAMEIGPVNSDRTGEVYDA